MFELAKDVLSVLRSGESVAIVTITGVARSAPRGLGASMAVTESGAIIGSISGGCVESDAGMLALTAIASGTGQTAQFGFTDDAAHAAGLACGGSVDVIAYPLRSDDSAAISALEAAEAHRVTAVGLIISGHSAGRILAMDALGTVIDTASNAALDNALRERQCALLPGAYAGSDVLILASAPPPRLIILGGGEHAAALCRVASVSGYSVTVCDAWDSLVTAERFPGATERVTGWPHEYLAGLQPDDIDERTAICVLTHDTRQDIPALRAALSMPVGFVGAMGARSTVNVRAGLLREQGVSDVDLARLHSPLGLDLGGSTPDETALSVLAEIVAARHGGSGAPLRDGIGPLHRTLLRTAPSCDVPSRTATA
ncbi:XdhC family protein [Microbacterium sp. NPDC076911]|uniref:XdhC family protein n=1 Tax=Microbacterium sp. NPDC076911 TaxID=3154958 RepID=UPI00342F4A65